MMFSNTAFFFWGGEVLCCNNTPIGVFAACLQLIFKTRFPRNNIREYLLILAKIAKILLFPTRFIPPVCDVVSAVSHHTVLVLAANLNVLIRGTV